MRFPHFKKFVSIEKQVLFWSTSLTFFFGKCFLLFKNNHVHHNLFESQRHGHGGGIISMGSKTGLKAWLGTTIRISMTPSRHNAKSENTSRMSGKWTPGRYFVFSDVCCIWWTCSRFFAQSRVSLPLRANNNANAVPQEPAPRTAIGVAFEVLLITP